MDSADRKILTKVMPGFMELLPSDQIAFEKMKSAIESVYRQFGFIPVDTPVIERAEVLLAKAGGETEKQIYLFKKGETELALRFDLTVPFARYVAEHYHDLAFPFRRYAIGKVYRGETPQKGRFREFYQCDIDIIDNESLDLAHDAEVASVIYAVFTKLNFGSFVIKMSNRKLIAGLLESLGIGALSVEVMRIIDKLEKVGKSAVGDMLAAAGVPSGADSSIFSFLDIRGTNAEILQSLRSLGIQNEIFSQGIEELKKVTSLIASFQVPEKCFEIDLSIARGLDYYTGTVYETKLVEFPQIGSVCSGGRYENLAEKYTSRKLPGVGVSIGLTRLFSQLKDAGLISAGSATTAKVLVVSLVSDMSIPLQAASMLRSKNIPTEIYFGDVKMKTKLGYADKLGIPYALIIGEDEIKAGAFTLRNMATGEQQSLPLGEIVSHIKDF